MNTHVSPSIIMRVKEFGESDLLIIFLAADKGRLKGIAKGARKSRKRFSNCLDLFCLVNLEYEQKRKGDFHFLHSCKLLHSFSGLRSDFSYLSLASYMIELTEVLFPPGVTTQNIFNLLKNSFFALSNGKNNATLRILFEAGAMALGGYGIDLERCCGCGRPYTGEGRAVFKQSKGGIACLRCEEERVLSPGLSPDSVRAMMAMQSAAFNIVEAGPLSHDVIREIKTVLKLHIDYRVGQRFKSSEYIE